MKVNISLVFLGAVAASAIALPAEAAIFTTPSGASVAVNSIDGSTALSEQGAYKITNLQVNYVTDPSKSGLYNIDFNFGSFFGLYGTPAGTQPAPGAYTDPTLPYPVAAGFADSLGSAIELALSQVSVVKIFNGGGVKQEFYIPKAFAAQNSNQDTFLKCVTTTGGACNNENISPESFNNVYFAQYTKTGDIPTGNNVPTPALIPGLLGMGLAALRKKQQAAVVAQEA
jgi:hypothetical protein